MSISFTGTEALNSELKKLANLQDVRNAVEVNTSELQKSAQRKVAVDSGTLKRSLTAQTLDGGFTGRVSTNVEYAAYQEFGTRRQTGTPYIRPSLKEQEIKFRNDLLRLMK